jgi:16S rRNA (guanine966-N2)-methyltransferase
MGVGEQRMRIVAGRFRGRKLAAPAGDTTRPTTDRVREAVFSSVVSYAGFDLGGGAVLDAFAGSGALGLEALSRGCRVAVFADEDRGALSTLAANVSALGVVAETCIVAGDVFVAMERGTLPGGPFALLMLDPPYRLDAVKVTGLLVNLVTNDLLADGAVAVWEHARGEQPVWPDGFELVKRKRYGTTEVDIALYERGA